MNLEFRISNLRPTLARYAAAIFFLALFAIFVLAPFSLKDKLDAVCYGI